MSDSHRRRRRSAAARPIRRTSGLSFGVERLEARELLTLAGNQLFPSDNPWNQSIANAPVASNSSAIINNVISISGKNGQLHPDFGQDSNSSNQLYGIPYNIVHGNTTTKVNVVIDGYPSESDIQPIPIPANPVIEGDLQDGPTVGLANRGDSHLIVYDQDSNIAYELFGASRPTENNDGQWHAAQESVWNMNQDSFRPQDWTSADAAGLPILSGLVRPDEGLPVSQGGQGVINHAIRFTLQNKIILDQFVYPASHVANPGNTNGAIEPAMGTRFRLKASVDISKLSPESQVIAQAMKTYGLILADNGSNFFFSGASESIEPNGSVLTWNDDDIQSTLTGLKSLNYGEFEVVNTTPLVTGLSSSTGSAGSTLTIVGQNFSGAAGHLQIFFGTSAATNVTVVDDSHASATIPSGTGTVDVRIQSGVTTGADSENSTSPIFGYGISATSAADRFTYGATPVPPVLGDAGFESASAGNAGYAYGPAGSPWTFTNSPGNGGSGVSANNSAFTSSNPNAPQGSQVAFLQDTGSITQSVAGWAAGNYSLSFDAAQRANYGTSREDFQVLIDGNVVATFKPTSTSYQAYTTSTFTVTAGTHVIMFLGLDSAGGDNTIFLDALTVAVFVASAPPVPVVGDAGFESASAGNAGYAYGPAGSPWTFTNSPGNGGSGVSANNSAFTSSNPNAPQGSQVAFLQDTGSITQSVAGWAAGNYSLSFDAAQRANYGTSREDFQVLIDGNVVATFKPTSTSYQAYTTSTFTVTAGTHVIMFLGLDSAGGDNTIFLDALTVAVFVASAPPVPVVGDAGFESASAGNAGYAYGPAGSPWTFTNSPGNGGSGVSANNSAFTSSNPNAPQGSQVAFLQDTGSITQSVAGWAAGNYSLSFDAAQRANYGTSREDFQVLIDGNVVATFKPTSTSYQAYTTSTFTVTAGTHVIMFLGLDSAGGDNTIFLDALTVAAH